MLNKGSIIPNPANPAKKAKTPRPITKTPADLKKSGAYFDPANDAEPNDSKASIGSVPKAKTVIIRDPEKNEPLAKAATCIA